MPIRRLTRYLVLLALPVGVLFLALRQGALPARWSPLAPLDLSEPDAWFVDWRLARLKTDTELCVRLLQSPMLNASVVADSPLKDGCGWTNGVRLAGAGGASVHVDRMTCELAAGLALWIAHEVQPSAEALLGAKVASIQHLGGYACRNVKGSPLWSDMRSEHAKANALDVAGFTLVGGRQISVARHWMGTSAESRFLHQVHARACRYFRVAIGPDYNKLHRDHFHYDRGVLSACK